MRIEIAEASVLWLDEYHELSLTELLELSGLSAAELQHLVECEALLPVVTVNPAAVEPAADLGMAEARFSARCLTLARAASRLRNDFDLDENALALTLRLLKRIHELEAELLDLRAQWPAGDKPPRPD
jgi:chaperone modulatory protein CbpM